MNAKEKYCREFLLLRTFIPAGNDNSRMALPVSYLANINCRKPLRMNIL